jgi:hypothetical protein
MARVPTIAMEGKKKYEIQHIWEVHQEVIRLLVMGAKPADISAQLGISKQQISNIRNSSIVKEAIEELQSKRNADAQKVSERIQRLAPKAIDRLQEVLDNPAYHDEKLVANVAKDILDRAGHGSVQKIAVGHAVLSPERIDEIKQRALDAGLSSGVVVRKSEEAEYEEED